MKNQILTIANEKFMVYNVTENMIHCIKLGIKGQALSIKNLNNFFNISPDQLKRFTSLGSIVCN